MVSVFFINSSCCAMVFAVTCGKNQLRSFFFACTCTYMPLVSGIMPPWKAIMTFMYIQDNGKQEIGKKDK